MREMRTEGTIYKVESAGGHGQTSTVFRAIREDSRGHSRQTVALKILNPSTDVEWLRREFETLTRVQSPYCVRVLGWENFQNGFALVLEWVDGLTLFELGQKHLLNDELIGEIIAQTQEGLRSLNECGLFHGDLSPANILVDRAGCIKLVDFGTLPSDRETVRGTTPYIAPEVWQGSTPDANADLFSLGLIEIDLRAGFSKFPKTILECRMRADALSADQGLLAKTPFDRKFKLISPNAYLKDQLAQAVREVIALREKAVVTSEMPTPSFTISRALSNFAFRAACLFILGILVPAVPVRAQAPQEIFSRVRASIHLRTQKWTEIELNGRRVGFAPLDLDGLLPGEHRISWKTSSASGEMHINLKAGDSIRLAETDLAANLNSGVMRKR